VPDHVKITALWFGISTGTWGSGRGGNPIGMNPILAHYRQPLPQVPVEMPNHNAVILT